MFLSLAVTNRIMEYSFLPTKRNIFYIYVLSVSLLSCCLFVCILCIFYVVCLYFKSNKNAVRKHQTLIYFYFHHIQEKL